MVSTSHRPLPDTTVGRHSLNQNSEATLRAQSKRDFATSPQGYSLNGDIKIEDLIQKGYTTQEVIQELESIQSGPLGAAHFLQMIETDGKTLKIPDKAK